VKPAMWTDGKIVRLTDGANLLFIALLSQADDEGRLVNDSKEIECKAPRFWERSELLLKELESVGLIQIFGDSKKYIQITNFLKHHKHKKERIVIDRPYDSTIPKTHWRRALLSEGLFYED